MPQQSAENNGKLAVRDSGDEPVIYALGPDGADRGRVRIAGAVNRDWEDIASFELNGLTYLLIADTGDNLAVRTDCRLYVIAEPDPAELSPGREITVPIAWEDVLIFPRAAGESWAGALTSSPQHLRTITLPQAEAVCFANDGGLFVTTEKAHAPLVRYQLAK